MATPNERTLKDFLLVDNEPLNKYKLELDGAYRWILCTFIFNMTNGANVPVFFEDHVMNYIRAVGIRRNGKTYKFNQPLRFAVKKQTADVGTPNFIVAPITTANETYESIVQYTIHFAEDLLNENDISALFQTGHLTNAELIIDAGDIDDIASENAPTLNSVKVEIEIRDFVGTGLKGLDINDGKDGEKMLDVFELVEEIPLESNRIDFRAPQEIDLVSGVNILEHAGYVTDNGKLSDDLVKDIQTWNVAPRTSDLQRNFKNLVRQTKTNFGLEDTLKGFFKIDWQEKLGRRGFKTGVKGKEVLQLLTNTVNVNEDKLWLYTKYV